MACRRYACLPLYVFHSVFTHFSSAKITGTSLGAKLVQSRLEVVHENVARKLQSQTITNTCISAEMTAQRYSDETKTHNERISYGEYASWQGFANDSTFLDPSSSRHRPCQHRYRAKYVCVPCRRTFKLHFRPELEYHFRQFDNTYFCRTRTNFAEQCAFFGLNGRSIRQFEEIERRRSTVLSGRSSNEETIKELKKIDPWMWTPLANLRCPGCGERGRSVGSVFEAPRHQDAKAWKVIEQKLDKGERFLFCPSQVKHEELMKEGRRIMERSARAAEWEAEKARRITALKDEKINHSNEGTPNVLEEWDIISESEESSWTEVS